MITQGCFLNSAGKKLRNLRGSNHISIVFSASYPAAVPHTDTKTHRFAHLLSIVAATLPRQGLAGGCALWGAYADCEAYDLSREPGRLDRLAVSKTALPTAKASRAEERKPMTSQDKPKNFMHELDEWTISTIVEPLYAAFAKDSEEVYVEAAQAAQKAIRAKVLESYHNGQKAGPRKIQAVARES